MLSKHLMVSATASLPNVVESTHVYTTPGAYTLAVAAGKAIRVDVKGAEGGFYNFLYGTPGKGGRTQGTYILAASTTLRILVGSQAPGNGSTQPGTPGGGSGGSGTNYGPGTGGGGYSGIFLNNSATQGNAVFIAGGGGGNSWFSNGGGGGGSNGGTGSNTYGGPVSTGGTQLAGGVNTSGSAGSALQGGNGLGASIVPGGGGGGGYFGGGGGCGGSTDPNPGTAAGGGGSGFIHPAAYDASMQTGVQSGHGAVTIEVLI